MREEERPRNKGTRPAGNEIAVSAAAGASASLSMSMRPYFSDYHVRAAAFFARQSAAMEREHAGKKREELGETAFYDHRACVMAAVSSSAAFLEAAINELFVDATDYEGGKMPPSNVRRPVEQLSPSTRRLMAGMWPFDMEWRRPLEKYQIALVLNDKPKLDAGASPYQDVDALLALRNTLTHSKPKDLAAGLKPMEETEKMAKKLRDKGFAPNPLFPEPSGNPYFPDKALGHGCARWAVVSSVALADDFFSRMEITPRYRRFVPLELG